MKKQRSNIFKELNEVVNQVTKAIFVTLIVGIFFAELGSLINNEEISTLLIKIGTIAKLLTGPAIGVAIGTTLSKNQIVIYTSAIVGALSAGTFKGEVPTSGDPLSAIIVTTVVVYIIRMIAKGNFYDMLLVPIVALILGQILLFAYTPIGVIVTQIGIFVNTNVNNMPLVVIPILATLLGIFMTGPFSSVLFAILLGLEGKLSFVGLCATCATMMSYGIMGLKDNGIAKSLVVFFGTPKLQFANTLKNKWLFLPTMIASIVASLAGWFLTNYQATKEVAGLGWCMVTGVLTTITQNQQIMNIGLLLTILVIIPIVIGMIGYIMLSKFNLIKKGDLKLS